MFAFSSSRSLIVVWNRLWRQRWFRIGLFVGVFLAAWLCGTRTAGEGVSGYF